MHFHTRISVPLNCLAFADDFILFTNGSKSCLQKIKNFLQLYEDISGQIVNSAKSSFTLCHRLSPSRQRIIGTKEKKSWHWASWQKGKYGGDLEQPSPCGVGLSMQNTTGGRIFIVCKLEPMTLANGKGC
ncbi:hypothetical protein LIER_16920 [Lithospermum erythrorhizon]|uniref:Reverse transcriptase domain-containing protein n=1 Tax=Lithospermum erythrorhizon TaxID=34254 RepID=A0AAV3QBN5_LITER